MVVIMALQAGLSERKIAALLKRVRPIARMGDAEFYSAWSVSHTIQRGIRKGKF